MNSLIIVLVVFGLFILAYGIYAARLQRLWEIDRRRGTPAFSKFDSVDYIPAKNWLVLFGHHFSSIAGAGPIIGPVIAVILWGWLPALLWVVLGTVFIGGTHDFGSLITSVREGGSSVADIAQQVISRRAKILFSLFVWLALILVIAVFAYLCADTFLKEPKIVLPSLGLIPVAILTGYLLYQVRANSALVTVFGLVFLSSLIIWGNSWVLRGDINLWLIILLAYCYFASILPVNLLLQPRDYLSSFLLFFGLGAGFLGLIYSRPVISMAPVRGWASQEGDIWPMLFVTVACGAVSGFHALIASGTTSKQIANEGQAKRIGFGAMLVEGLVAVMAIIAVAAFFKKGEVAGALLRTKGPIGIFASGYGQMTRGILGGYGAFVAITVLNAFILTTLDTATRISRYLTEELFGIKNRYFSTLIIVTLSGALAFSGKWNKIWPAFGASNQLVASLALFVLTCWLLSKNKPVGVTLIPALFMLFTTLAALIYQCKKALLQQETALFLIVALLIILAAFMSYDVFRVLIRRRKNA